MANIKDCWLSGFTDGEGCFRIEPQRKSSYQITFRITLRADDDKILEKLQKHFGGAIYYSYPSLNQIKRTPNAKPACKWCIQSKNDILRLTEYFDKYPLQTKKKEEYMVWREASQLYFRYSVGSSQGMNPQWLIDAMEAYRREITTLKQYRKCGIVPMVMRNEMQNKLFAESEVNDGD